MDFRDISIITQAAAHDAATIYAAEIRANGVGFDLDRWTEIHMGILRTTVSSIQADAETLAVGQVQQAFPGSEVMPTPQPTQPAMVGAGAPAQPVPMPTIPQQQGWTAGPIVPTPPMPNGGYPPPQIQQPPPVPQAPPPGAYPQQQQQQQLAPNMGVRCPKCNGDAYDNRNDNQRKRQYGYRLLADIKCKNKQCGGVVWPPDYQTYAQAPAEPR